MRVRCVNLALSLCLTVLFPGFAESQSPGGVAQLDSTFLKWNAATRTATFKLVAGIPGRAKSPFNFDGFTDGELTLTFPVNSTVVLNFVNEDGTPHSAQVIPDTRPIPNLALDQPAIPRPTPRRWAKGLPSSEPTSSASRRLRRATTSSSAESRDTGCRGCGFASRLARTVCRRRWRRPGGEVRPSDRANFASSASRFPVE